MKTIDPNSKYRGPISMAHALYVVMRGRCFYCGARKNLSDMTEDHVMPRRRGGRDHFENVVLACAPCNKEKDDRVPTANETQAAKLVGNASHALQSCWQMLQNFDHAHMTGGGQVTSFVDRAAAGEEPGPMESADA